ncbi:MAG: NAD(P)-dependent oxidoreductase [Gemmatimonadaceae bacterium]
MTPPSSSPRVAMLGLGIMGSGMARRLLAAGLPLTVFNRSAEKAQSLAQDGATVARSPREAAANADIVFSMVADDGASRAMWDGADGALAGARRGTVLVECSTVTVERIAELAAASERAGCAFADAPVTGSKMHAAAGELTFLVGSDDDTLQRIRPALDAMGKTIHHLGPVTSGALVKLINNFLCGVQAASLAEALAIIECSSLDRDRTLNAILNGSPGSPVMKTLAARMTTPDFTPNFYLHLLAKDMGYAIGEGESRGVPMATATAALDMLRASIDRGDGDRDMAAVVEQFRARQHA